MNKINKKLSEIFDVEPIILDQPKQSTEIVEIKSENVVEQDAQLARENIKDLVNKGNRAIEELAVVARDSQHPRAYEVMAGMLKNLADMNKDLLQIHKQKQEIMGETNSNKDVNIDKAVFVGSTAELMKLIKNNK